MKIKTRQELEAKRAEYAASLKTQKKQILICAGTGCVAGGSLNIYARLQEILKERGILTLFQDMGKRPDSCKGFYLHQDRIGCVTINSALGVDMQRIIAAHELGHALLHKTAAQDFCVFDDASRLEYEANLFAAELLLGDDETLGALREENDFCSVAAALYVPPQLLAFKLRSLNRRGLLPSDASLYARSDFLRNFPAFIPENRD